MCGIAGIIGGKASGINAEKMHRDMLRLMRHRGPDGEGQWSAENGPVWLGHRRLAIIDPEGGQQPLDNEDGSIWLTFNGCIYNYQELAQTLARKGHRFKTHTDSEVIVHAYEEWGEECIDKFIGMFAFAIWDGRKKKLFCARDRLGIKPFYYWMGGGSFVFASEIKALLVIGLFRPESNRYALSEYLTFQAPLGEKTLFKGVYRLLPGHTMTVDASGEIISKKKYWDLEFSIDRGHALDYQVDHLRLLLSDAVKIRLRSDVPLGAHLSGGLDSSAIVALASELNDGTEALQTFSGGFSHGKEFDETFYARLVAERVGARYHEIRPTAEDLISTLPKIIYHLDEPAAGPGVFPQFMVSKLASENVKVVLGGQGGDELFAGYARYLVAYLEECLKGAIEETEDTAEFVATLQTIIPNLTLLKQYKPMLRGFWGKGLFDTQDKRYFQLMDRSVGAQEIFHPEFFQNREEIFDSFKGIFYGSDASSYLNRMLYFDLKVHLPALLHIEDRTSMAWGLESRVPLIDHRIAEFIAGVSPVNKFKGGEMKYLFKRAIKNTVPNEILARKDKMGFPVPLHLWFKGPLKDFIHDTLLSEKARNRGIFKARELEAAVVNEQAFGRSIWGALCLELWFQTFIDNPL